jgi:NADPH:quinone reductase-like Zn-dependent oxidoreductase
VVTVTAAAPSGRIATQLAKHHGARVLTAVCNQRVLVQLLVGGADAAIRVDRPRSEQAWPRAASDRRVVFVP